MTQYSATSEFSYKRSAILGRPVKPGDDTLRCQIPATDFHIRPETQEALRQSGRAAAERFLQAWDFGAYVDGLRTAPVIESPATREPEAA